MTTDKLQVHTVTRKVDLKSNRHTETSFFAPTALKFVAAHMSVGAAKLGNICFCSKVFSTTFSSLARP